MKSNSILRLITGLMVILCLFGMAGCANKTNNPTDPKDAIIDKYGNTQFKITFDATNLASPISDMYYSAENMPVLPGKGRLRFCGMVFRFCINPGLRR